VRCEFLHLSDIHLGYQQYGHPERFNDFGRAFLSAVRYAVENQVGFVLISGDLFHKSAIDPPTLLQAVSGLQQLQEAGIAVIAVAGNHDRPRYRDRFSWLDYLAERGHLVLLSPVFDEEQIRLPPWDGRAGAYIDIHGVRIYGVPYLGASIRPVLAGMLDVLADQDKDEVEFTVLMAHFGLEGEMPGVPGGLSHNEIAPLRDCVDYLALGHWHKPFEREGWIYNPGTLETCALDEYGWQGGFYHAAVDTESDPKHTARHIRSRRRPFHRLIIPVDEYTTPQDVYDGLRARLEAEKSAISSSDLAPVVEVTLEGVLAFDRGSLDTSHIQEQVNEALRPLIVRVRNNTRPSEFEIPFDERLSRRELEHKVLSDLILRDSRYRDRVEVWAELMTDVKTMALAGSPPEAIVATMRQRIVEPSED
jgi:DNA repair exonuclease SbcCD nuclease subunit